MNNNDKFIILRFNKVSFGYDENKPLLEDANFFVRKNTKVAIMGQNGSGKTTIFDLMQKSIFPDSGMINIEKETTIAASHQVIPRSMLDLTVREFFEKSLSKRFSEKIYDIDPKIEEVLNVVNLNCSYDKKVRFFSGGQQARLLLASAIIQKPDLLLLDEPTNNLDKEGIENLKNFLTGYKKTCIIISHDADFLNSFVDSVLYVFNKSVEQYVGNYLDVVERIRILHESTDRKNVMLKKEIQGIYNKVSYFGNKGGRIRLVVKRMKKKAKMLEEKKIEVRRDDKTISPFVIPSQSDVKGLIVRISDFSVMQGSNIINKKTNIELRKNERLLLKGPNGIGKTTLLESIVKNQALGIEINSNVKIGYYRQDFSILDFDSTVYESLSEAAGKKPEGVMRSVAAGFLINSELMDEKIGNLSEGQKGLISFARLVLQEPGLLILDEPTNHINFRHIPIIAEALNKYAGTMIIVSHSLEFIDQLRIDSILDLES